MTMNFETALKTINDFDLSANEEAILTEMLNHTSSEAVKKVVTSQLTNDFVTYADEQGRTGYICNMAPDFANSYPKSMVIAYAKALLKAIPVVEANLLLAVEDELDTVGINTIERDIKVLKHLITTSEGLSKYTVKYGSYKGQLIITREEAQTRYVIHLHGAGRSIVNKVVKHEVEEVQADKVEGNRLFKKVTKVLTAAVMAPMILAACPVHAAFKNAVWTDEMDNTVIHTTKTYTKVGRDNQYIGFECRVKEGKSSSDIRLTFGGDESIATPNSNVDLRLKVDKGEIYGLKGKTYSNSYRAGVVFDVPNTLFTEIMQGNKLHTEIGNYGRIDVIATFNLSGSTSALKHMMNKCGVVVGESDELVLAKQKINQEYDKKIDAINAEREKKLKAIQIN